MIEPTPPAMIRSLSWPDLDLVRDPNDEIVDKFELPPRPKSAPPAVKLDAPATWQPREGGARRSAVGVVHGNLGHCQSLVPETTRARCASGSFDQASALAAKARAIVVNARAKMAQAGETTGAAHTEARRELEQAIEIYNAACRQLLQQHQLPVAGNWLQQRCEAIEVFNARLDTSALTNLTKWTSEQANALLRLANTYVYDYRRDYQNGALHAQAWAAAQRKRHHAGVCVAKRACIAADATWRAALNQSRQIRMDALHLALAVGDTRVQANARECIENVDAKLARPNPVDVGPVRYAARCARRSRTYREDPGRNSMPTSLYDGT